MIAQEYGFPTDAATIGARAAHTQEIVAIRVAGAPLSARLVDLLGIALPSSQPPAREDLPPTVGEDVERLRFYGVTTIRWGLLPLPMMQTPNWIGPEGFTKFEAYKKHGGSWYLTTMMSDGHAFSVGTRPSGNANTDWRPSTGSFERDYRGQLEAVRDYMDKTGEMPVYRPTAQDIAQVWRLFYVDSLTPATALMSLMIAWVPLVLLIMAAYFVLELVVPAGLP